MEDGNQTSKCEASGIGLVVFDLAGTLVDCGSRAPVVAFAAAFEQQGVPVSEEEIRRFMGASKRDHVEALLGVPRVAGAWLAVHGQPWRVTDADAVYKCLLPLQASAAADATELVPGAKEGLTLLLETGVRFATTTGYPRSIGAPVAAALRESEFHSVIDVFTDDVSAGRPAPWMIHRCMESANVFPSSRVVNVGDTTMDVKTGRNAGVWSVAVTLTGSEVGVDAGTLAAMSEEEKEALHREIGDRMLARGADAVVRSVADVPALVTELERRMAGGELPSGLRTEFRS